MTNTPIPAEGDRWRAADGTVYVAESVSDLTDDPDFAPGDPRFMIELCLPEDLGDMGAPGVGEFLEDEFEAFAAEEGLTKL